MRVVTVLSAIVAFGCAGRAAPAPIEASLPAPEDASTPPRARALYVVGTSDLHGHLESLPRFGGYLRALREQAKRDGAAVLLLDAGDMYQGTLESNLVEGASVARAYELLGYDAVAVGNHEFDFGPVGPKSHLAPGEDGDHRGALKALASSVSYPFLLANAVARGEQPARHVELPPLRRRALLEVGGIRVGVVGVTSIDTATTTLRMNVADLSFAPLAESVAREAAALRAEGASVVVALAHAGSKCAAFTGDVVADGCQEDGEIFQVARALPKGSVDAIIAGHTHAAVAHVVSGVPILQSYAYGRAFGRVDLTLGAGGQVTEHVVHPPTMICAEPTPEGCAAVRYAGAEVRDDPALVALVTEERERTRAGREAPVGVELTGPFRRAYDTESALGNLFASLLARGDARHLGRVDVALMNGGGLRADLPAGPLRYGELFEATPFDNHRAVIPLPIGTLRELFRHNLQSRHGILSVAGLVVVARCVGTELEVELFRADARGRAIGRALRESAPPLNVLVSDFLLHGGDDFSALGLESSVAAHSGAVLDTSVSLRDALAATMAHSARLEPALYLDAKHPRVRYPGSRPVECGAR